MKWKKKIYLRQNQSMRMWNKRKGAVDLTKGSEGDIEMEEATAALTKRKVREGSGYGSCQGSRS